MRTLRLVAHTPSCCTIGIVMRGVSKIGCALILLIGCGEAAPAAEHASGEPSSGGDEQVAAEQAAEAEAEQAEQAAREAEKEKALGEVQSSAMRLGVNVAALDQTLEAPQIDCARAYKLADHVCELAQNMCGIAESHEEAQGQCERAQGKCERGKSDVKAQRCQRPRG